jgi:hypothetical protein
VTVNTNDRGLSKLSGPSSLARLSHLSGVVKGGVTAIVAAMTVVAGCGSQRPPPAGDSTYTPAQASGGFQDGGVSNKPPGCGQKDDGSFCDCVDTPLFSDPPNMYFVLDRSGSMAEEDKWGKVRLVVSQILRGLGPRANFGATLFPGFDNDACAPPKEVLPLSPGDPPGTQDGPTTKRLLSATINAPSGGTPTAEALRSTLKNLQGAKGKTFVILATDGGPNCNSGNACSVDQCQPNIESVPGCPPGGTNCCAPPNGVPESCLDSAATVSAVAALKTAGIPVYVIGLPGTGNPTYASLLDTLASAGGTALPTSPKYYRIDSSNSDVLLAALKKIAAQIVATCEFKLTMAPAQPNQVNVYFDEVVVPADPVNGWKIDGQTVTLLGDSCKKVLSGDVLDVRIITGCPTVQPR